MTTSAPTSFAGALARFSALVDADLDAILMREEQVPNLQEAVAYSLGLDLADAKARGKRIRPVLCLVTTEALGGDPAAALPFASAIELFHNFALIHDDIEDGDQMRRNRPCTYIRYGIGHGVNSGDYALCKSIASMLRPGTWDDGLRLRLLGLLSETLDHTHIGQALDMNARTSRSFTIPDYLRIVREKTGFYLAAPFIGGAMIAGAPAPVLDALRRFGHAVGPLFQIVDDLIDLTEGKGRGIRGSDIREGKRSYLVAASMGHTPAADEQRLYDILDKPRAETTDADVAWAEAHFRACGAFDRAHAYCDQLRAEALSALDETPARLRDVLTEAAEMMQQRKT